MHGKEIHPNREKKTTISFPLKNPEPITVPTVTRKVKNDFFINIIY